MKLEQLLRLNDFNPIEFHNMMHNRILVRPMYFELGFSSTQKIFGRGAVFNGLMKAMDLLPSEYGFLIWDIYRPRAVQAKLFDWMRDEIRKKFSHLTDKENYEETKKYMSAPSKVGDNYCPPHLSGGAIDLTLYNIATGQEVNMGTVFDDCTDVAHSDYYDLKINSNNEEKEIQASRNLLRRAMEQVGFTGYKYEWWHFDMGDIFWSRIVNKPPIFGPLFGDEEWPDNMNVEVGA